MARTVAKRRAATVSRKRSAASYLNTARSVYNAGKGIAKYLKSSKPYSTVRTDVKTKRRMSGSGVSQDWSGSGKYASYSFHHKGAIKNASLLKGQPQQKNINNIQGSLNCTAGQRAYFAFDTLNTTFMVARFTAAYTAAVAYQQQYLYFQKYVQEFLITSASNATTELFIFEFQARKQSAGTPIALLAGGIDDIGGTNTDYLGWDVDWKDAPQVSKFWTIKNKKKFLLGVGETIKYKATYNINLKFMGSDIAASNTYDPRFTHMTVICVQGGAVATNNVNTSVSSASAGVNYIRRDICYTKCMPFQLPNTYTLAAALPVTLAGELIYNEEDGKPEAVVVI